MISPDRRVDDVCLTCFDPETRRLPSITCGTPTACPAKLPVNLAMPRSKAIDLLDQISVVYDTAAANAGASSCAASYNVRCNDAPAGAVDLATSLQVAAAAESITIPELNASCYPSATNPVDTPCNSGNIDAATGSDGGTYNYAPIAPQWVNVNRMNKNNAAPSDNKDDLEALQKCRFKVVDISASGVYKFKIIDGWNPESTWCGTLAYKGLVFNVDVIATHTITEDTAVCLQILEYGSSKYVPTITYQPLANPRFEMSGFVQVLAEVKLDTVKHKLKISQIVKEDVVAPDDWQQYGDAADFALTSVVNPDTEVYTFTVADGHVIITGLSTMNRATTNGLGYVPVTGTSFEMSAKTFVYLKVSGHYTATVVNTTTEADASAKVTGEFRKLLWTIEPKTSVHGIAFPIISRNFAGPVVFSDIDAPSLPGYDNTKRQSLTQNGGTWEWYDYTAADPGASTGYAGYFKTTVDAAGVVSVTGGYAYIDIFYEMGGWTSTGAVVADGYVILKLDSSAGDGTLTGTITYEPLGFTPDGAMAPVMDIVYVPLAKVTLGEVNTADQLQFGIIFIDLLSFPSLVLDYDNQTTQSLVQEKSSLKFKDIGYNGYFKVLDTSTYDEEGLLVEGAVSIIDGKFAGTPSADTEPAGPAIVNDTEISCHADRLLLSSSSLTKLYVKFSADTDGLVTLDGFHLGNPTYVAGTLSVILACVEGLNNKVLVYQQHHGEIHNWIFMECGAEQ